MPRAKINVLPILGHRGGGGVSTVYYAQSATFVKAWGSEPGTAEIVYVGDAVPEASILKIELLGHTFWGSCRQVKDVNSSQGKDKTLSFVDLRDYLEWDRAYCAFNKEEIKLVNGVLTRRYWHVLPVNFNTLTKTFTTDPYTASQIINFLLSAPTTEDLWITSYHADQNQPVYNLDFLGGPSLRQALQEVSDKQGLTFTLSDYFHLTWGRKGEGTAITFPATSDHREDGGAMSTNPTRIRVLGERNRYQVHNLNLVPDWNGAWEAFYDFYVFQDDIYARGKLTSGMTIGSTNYAAGTLFTAVSDDDDPDRLITQQLAAARAAEITVWEYAELRGNHNTWDDYRRFAGKSRLDMPAALYINAILFRAFRVPSNYNLLNGYGRLIPQQSLSISDRMVASVTHDPSTGLMSWFPADPPAGNGYAIVRGYQVGKDLFATIRPERFKIADWKNTQDVWEHHEFQIDDSGDGEVGYLLFAEPIIRSEDLVDLIDGYAVFKARPTIGIPNVRAALVFEAEIFSYVVGVGTRDGCENVSGLCAEFAGAVGFIPAEIPYADGDLASAKAQDIANALLNGQFVYRCGRHVNYPTPDESGNYPAGTALTTQMDRIVVQVSPDGGQETVQFTSEKPRATYVPERHLDRTSRLNTLLPGQEQLRATANIHKLTAAALNQDSKARKTLTNAFRGFIGLTQTPTKHVTLKDGDADTKLLVGVPLWKKRKLPEEEETDRESRPVLPANTTPDHTIFAGVTTRHQEPSDATIPTIDHGEALAQVQGPIEANDPIGRGPDGTGYLAADGTPSVGTALQEIEDDAIKLILVRLGASAAVEQEPIWLP
jgi:hypothetical protein